MHEGFFKALHFMVLALAVAWLPVVWAVNRIGRLLTRCADGLEIEIVLARVRRKLPKGRGRR